MASDRSSAVEPPRWSGRAVVFVLLGFGLLLAGGARIWHGRVERRPLEYWGETSVGLIHSATEGEVLVFAPPPGGPASGTAPAPSAEGSKDAAAAPEPPAAEPPAADPASDTIVVDGAVRRIEKRRTLPSDSSFVHLRRILLSDYCYQWNSPPSSPPEWSMALRIEGPKGTLKVLFDFKHHQVRDFAGGRTVVLSPLAIQPFQALAQPPQAATATSSAAAASTAPPPAGAAPKTP